MTMIQWRKESKRELTIRVVLTFYLYRHDSWRVRNKFSSKLYLTKQLSPPPPLPEKIKRDIMISNYKNESLRMIDIKSFSKALKSTWVEEYLDYDNHGK